MKRFLSILSLALALLAVTACGQHSGKNLLPNVTGKAGEVIVVIDRESWEGAVGNELRELLSGDCPYLAQREPMFNVANVPPANFTNLFKVHRNIVLVNIDPQFQEPGVLYKRDEWSHPQAVVQVSAWDRNQAAELIRDNGENIVEFIEQAERDRIIANSILYENVNLEEPVKQLTGGILHFPSGYKLKKQTEDFLWIVDDKQFTSQDVLVFKYPAISEGNFDPEVLMGSIGDVLRENVPGMFENTWMITSEAVPVSLRSVSFKGRPFMEIRGFWEVYNDFMGGPFVAHAFYSPDGQDIEVLYAFVYAPKYDKRQYLRQVESILYSFEWWDPATDVKNKKK